MATTPVWPRTGWASRMPVFSSIVSIEPFHIRKWKNLIKSSTIRIVTLLGISYLKTQVKYWAWNVTQQGHSATSLVEQTIIHIIVRFQVRLNDLELLILLTHFPLNPWKSAGGKLIVVVCFSLSFAARANNWRLLCKIEPGCVVFFSHLHKVHWTLHESHFNWNLVEIQEYGWRGKVTCGMWGKVSKE